jgi:hypothetical protein
VRNFFDTHAGETCLLVGNGPNLYATRPEWFDFPSFGANTIHMYAGNWKPTYYVAVDEGVFEIFGKEVNEKYAGVPKFVSSPTLDCWQGEDVYHFKKVSGDIRLPKREDVLKSLTYHNVMNAAMLLAWHMGFTTMLIIGMEQKPGIGELKKHFWGTFDPEPDNQLDTHWNIGYKNIIRAMGDRVTVLNISEGTYVPDSIIPRDDWRKYAKVTA